jgi:replicative DNA helicase
MIKTSTKGKIYNFSELNTSILNSNLILLAGRIGIGKSTFAINYSDYISKFVSKRVLYFTFEMNITEVGKCRNNYNYKELDYTGDSKLEIFDNILSFESLINKIKEEKELSLVIIDYLQLLGSSGENEEIKKDNIDSTINQLKNLSEDLNFPIVLLSHLPRFTNSENIDENIPNPTNLRLIDYKKFDLILMVYDNENESRKNIVIYNQEQIIGEINLK